MSVTQYWIKYLDTKGKDFASEAIECETEMDALARALARQRRRQASHGFELWRDDRRIYIERELLSA